MVLPDFACADALPVDIPEAVCAEKWLIGVSQRFVAFGDEKLDIMPFYDIHILATTDAGVSRPIDRIDESVDQSYFPNCN